MDEPGNEPVCQKMMAMEERNGKFRPEDIKSPPPYTAAPPKATDQKWNDPMTEAEKIRGAT